MKPGRELDALVHERVMGMSEFAQFSREIWAQGDETSLPHYSTDIKAAWDVVIHLQGMSFGVMRLAGLNSYQAMCGQEHGWIDGESVPHAICLAALKAIGINVV